LVAGTEYATAIFDESRGGVFRLIGDWNPLPPGVTVISPGRQYVQVSNDVSDDAPHYEYQYPNSYESLTDPEADIDVMGVGFAIVFDRFGRIDQSLIDSETPRLVEMTLVNQNGNPDGLTHVFVADDVVSDSINEDGASDGYRHQRQAVNGFAQLEEEVSPDDALIEGLSGIQATPLDEHQFAHVIDHQAPFVVRYFNGGNRISETRSHADEQPDAQQRFFLATRAFAVTDYVAVVSTGDLSLLYDLAVREASSSDGIAFHRDLAPVWFADASNQDALFPDTGTIADQLPFRDVTSATGKFRELASRFEWLAFHRATGQLMPVTEAYNR
ncbi:MAG: hypothetical protein AAGB34_02040, partial [Planctomycetota bacterium]